MAFVATTVTLSHMISSPTSDLIDYFRRILNGLKPIFHRVPRGNPFSSKSCAGRGRRGPCVPAATPIFHHPLRRPVRLTCSADSVSCPTDCRGDSATLRSPGNTPLGSTDSLCRATRWGTLPGHMPGVRFATREPAVDACTFYGSDGCCWNAEW